MMARSVKLVETVHGSDTGRHEYGAFRIKLGEKMQCLLLVMHRLLGQAEYGRYQHE